MYNNPLGFSSQSNTNNTRSVILGPIITNKDIHQQVNRVMGRVKQRALIRIKNVAWGQGLSGANGEFSQSDSDNLVGECLHQELCGLPMPYDNGGQLDGWLSKTWNKIKKSATKIARKVESHVKKIAPVALAGAAMYFGGPLAMKAVDDFVNPALFNTTSTASIMEAIGGKPKIPDPVTGQPKSQLPVGVTNAQAALLVKGQIPPGMTATRAKEIIEQAKLIASGLTPAQAYNKSRVMSDNKSGAAIAIQNPTITTRATQSAINTLQNQGLDMQSGQSRRLVEMQIKQAQQEAAIAAIKNRPYNPPSYSPQQMMQPAVTVIDRSASGAQEVRVEPEKSGLEKMTPLLVAGVPILMMMMNR